MPLPRNEKEKTERRERLLLLVNRLKNLPETLAFNMGVWGIHTGGHEPPEENYCGTTACALGHAALMPEFQKLGLQPKWYKTTGETGIVYGMDVKFDDGFSGGRTWTDPTDAGAAFFHLSDGEATELFLALNRPLEAEIALLEDAAAREVFDF
jgi:hypothetical protein